MASTAQNNRNNGSNKPLAPEARPLNPTNEGNDKNGKKKEGEVTIELNSVVIGTAISVGLTFIIIIIIVVILLLVIIMSGGLLTTESVSLIAIESPIIVHATKTLALPEIPKRTTTTFVDEDQPLYEKIKFTFEPQSSSVCLGASTTLTCRISQPVQCNWNRNDQLLLIADRYSIPSPINEDCSITITDVNRIDLGKWTCWFYDERGNEISADAQIIEKNADKCEGQREVALGATVDLGCEFEEATECVWLRNETQVSISGRYRFSEGDGKNSRRCGLTISAFAKNDVGRWTCVSPANSNRLDAITQQPITLVEKVF